MVGSCLRGAVSPSRCPVLVFSMLTTETQKFLRQANLVPHSTLSSRCPSLPSPCSLLSSAVQDLCQHSARRLKTLLRLPPYAYRDNSLSSFPRVPSFPPQFKTFANTRFKPTMYSPHRAVFDGPKGKDGLEPYMVDENFKRIERGRNKVSTHKRATVYHYVIKSLEDFQYKMARGGGAGVTRPKYYFTLMDKYSKVTCNGAIKTKERFCAARGL